ncbi:MULTISPECIES: imidazole glycerol phosphate synthase subunit HisH [unclassified Clostridioides]|uniref:imidazole glycerol phosphate synthase subunit HisH n=1 Tax=unclassified Clostridioides TaxID=2635829 RepID=UPI001D10D557|nr:imidazole glycerol phosphate synthase subunit HisH [Clostridioides sp. ZZV15-6388]MCC0659441.1 imidazole glycerol phosphate synthase subunit HisH [Clostridioides sp. ZZV14-6154]MCC0666298.1 imidazole glycerol phosphate synthase subunit HisH [Clostridioides sp. ZZV15-6597]MCC0667046.1 imidazole glycerol phosphate synthase subunit HisH [Clostridioides sp. ZZV14-6153]MCC0718678.1 imidazole glycerol phosphate synthase subunit HisH [Clostridioides sp. ZZV14-6105]MCC0726313.1 imidazole glycerol p
MNIIVDYGLGNIDSVSRGFKKAGIETKISNNLNEIKEANSLILPGVGAFRDSINALNKLDLVPIIKEHVSKGKFLIGICLGMQLLYEKSYEYGEYEGLGLIEGSIDKLDISLKVPHMGWNNLKFNKKNDDILKYIKEDDYVYFVHSYYANSSNEELVAFSEYEKKIPAIVRKDNVYGIQFHPEKSGEVGLNILKAYGEMIK